MATDSTALGYLAPISEPVSDDALDDILHDAVVGVVGIPGDLVRPRWQPEPPTQPSFETNWCALGVVRTGGDVFAAQTMDKNEVYTVARDELLYVLHSFYGPNASGNVARFRDGLMIDQNRDALLSFGVALVEVQEATILPALLKEKWVRRVDVTVLYRRRTYRPYPVRTITSAQGQIFSQVGTTPIVVVSQ